MIHYILMATFPHHVNDPTADSYTYNNTRPFFGRNGDPVSFEGAKFSTIAVEDDGETKTKDGFDRIFYSKEYDQTLVEPVTFGDDTDETPAGTQMTLTVGSLIKDQDGNPFQIVFTYSQPSHGASQATLLGGYKSVLIFPLPTGKPPALPTFDPNKTFTYAGPRGNGEYYTPSYDPNQQPIEDPQCFTPGTLIDTPRGSCLVEDLRVGDLVQTLDHGPQPLRWIGRAKVSARDLDLNPALRPIRIKAGALGNGLPTRDLTVSPQHRVLIRSRLAQELFGQDEVLVAAKHLLGLAGVRVMRGAKEVEYLHLLFDRHEVIISNGAPTESLFTGPMALKALSAAAKREIMALFPSLREGRLPDPARNFLNGREGRLLATRQRASRNEPIGA